MIREVIREAWRQDPEKVIVAILATPAVLLIGWFVLTLIILAGTPE